VLSVGVLGALLASGTRAFNEILDHRALKTMAAVALRAPEGGPRQPLPYTNAAELEMLTRPRDGALELIREVDDPRERIDVRSSDVRPERPSPGPWRRLDPGPGRPRSRSGERSASVREERSGRATKTRVVCAGSRSASLEAAYSGFCAFNLDSGPRQDVPPMFESRKVDHAAGSSSKRKVCPVGAVSKMT